MIEEAGVAGVQKKLEETIALSFPEATEAAKSEQPPLVESQSTQ